MKFGNGLGYTRDLDKPHQDDEDGPNKGVLAEFYERVHHVHNETGEKLYTQDNGSVSVAETGKPLMSAPILMIRFHTTGDPKSIAPRKARPTDKREFAQSWKAFQEGKSFTSVAGTPIDVLRDLDIMNKAALQAQGFYSLEQLRDASESVVNNPVLRNWVDRAREHLALNRPRHNPQELLDKMAAMQAELDALKAAKAPAKTTKNQEGLAA